MCSGVGTIGCVVAANNSVDVIGVELIPEAVESAKKNAELNEIRNVQFLCGKAEVVLPKLLCGEKILPERVRKGESKGEDGNQEELESLGLSLYSEVVAIVDPPRVGLHKDVLKALRVCKRITGIVYVSCNPISLTEDVVELEKPVFDKEDKFFPRKLIACDMFPHTLHLEMIRKLERYNEAHEQLSKGEPKCLKKGE